MNSPVLLEASDITRTFALKGAFGASGTVRAVNGISLCLREGETLGLVGESGCGKSTLGRCLLRLIEPDSGRVLFGGRDFLRLKGRALREARREAQMVFQDPYMSLDPKMRAGAALMEALKIHGLGTREERFAAAMKLMMRMGFHEEHFFRFPHEFSGGQRQRVGLARALILRPKMIVCDEPVSALDVSVQAQIINLMKEIQEETRVAYLFITHNLSVVRTVSDRVAVMYLGHIVEEAPTDELFSSLRHPYTQALLSAAAVPDPRMPRRRVTLKGEVPSPLHVPQGCVFSTRCPRARAECAVSRPPLAADAPGSEHRFACFYPLDATDALAL